jgi:hypothetical protein
VTELLTSAPGRTRGRHVDTTLAYGQVFKNLVMTVGSLAIIGFGIWQLAHALWVFGLVLIFIIEPIWLFASDLATGLILLPFVGIAALRRGEREEQESEWPY